MQMECRNTHVMDQYGILHIHSSLWKLWFHCIPGMHILVCGKLHLQYLQANGVHADTGTWKVEHALKATLQIANEAATERSF